MITYLKGTDVLNFKFYLELASVIIIAKAVK